MLYAVLYVCVCCFVVCGCAVSRRYIDVCYCDMFSVVNVYLDHLKFCVVCTNARRYGCCGECCIFSNECDEPTSCLVQPIVAHCCEVMYFGCFIFGLFIWTGSVIDSLFIIKYYVKIAYFMADITCYIFRLSPIELIILLCLIWKIVLYDV